MQAALTQGFAIINDSMELMMKEPMVYFVALGLISAGAKVTKTFVPSKRG